ncbi:MAG: DNA polymerase III subunit beta [bacterium]|nr:DNA polymerase III subunit beta [bacterium]
MEFTCKTEEFHRALQTVQRTCGQRRTMPVLSHIYLECSSEGLRMVSTDLTVSTFYKMPASVIEEGKVTFPGRLLSEIVSTLLWLPEEELKIESDQGHLRLVCGKADYHLNTIPVEEFPSLTDPEYDIEFTMQGVMFKEMVKQVLFAVSDDESKPGLCGVYMELSGSNLKIVATDTRRLALRNTTLSSTIASEQQFIVPSKALVELARLPLDGDIHIKLSEKQISFTVDHIRMVSQLVEAKFPDYTQVIPSEHRIRTKIDAFDLSNNIRGIVPLARESSNTIRFEFTGNRLRLSSVASSVGEVVREMAVENEGGDLEIGFNVRFVLDVLNNLLSEKVVMELTEPLRQAVFRPEENEDYLCVVMPIRLAANSPMIEEAAG